MKLWKADPRLLGAVEQSAGFPNVPYDLKKVRVLEQFSAHPGLWPDEKHPRTWLETEAGEFNLIGEMPNLHTLLFPVRLDGHTLEVHDFAFLKKCQKLRKLDVSCTNFTDCSLLTELPALRWVNLPPEARLLHTEALDGLKATVEIAGRPRNGGNDSMKKIDLRLLGAMNFAKCFPNVPYDLKNVRVLDKFDILGPHWQENGQAVRDWLETERGAFELLGEMPNLHTLLMASHYCEMSEIRDFSFLKQCKKLKKLDVSCTNFSDCALLAELPALRWVRLPHQDQLIHCETLQTLNATVEISDRRWQKPAPSVPETPVIFSEPPALGSEKLQKLADELRRLTERPAYRLFLDPEAEPTIFDSKFGGLPYWPADKTYPTDRENKPMQLLAQLNLETLAAGEPLPQTGMLQFFIAQNDVYGADFEDSCTQRNYRVVYHEQLDDRVTPEQVHAQGAPAFAEVDPFCTPLGREFAVYAEPHTCYITDCDRFLEKHFRTAVKNAWGEDIGETRSFQYLDEADYNDLFESLSDLSDGSMNGGHWLLGYPSFTQGDPRDEDSPYDTLLLQIDSADDLSEPEISKRSYHILWGDCGVGNFFIRRRDLENRDFSRVLFTWDCC